MEEQVHRKESILRQLKKDIESGALTQERIVDLRQELERSTHIQNHMLRGNLNLSGRYFCSFIGFLGGLFYWMNRIPIHQSYFLRKNLLLFAPITGAGALVGYYYGAKRHSNVDDGRTNKKIIANSNLVNKEFYEIIDNLILTKKNPNTTQIKF